MPDVNGLSQRVMYSGIYFWMLIVVRQIERERRWGVQAETLKIRETEFQSPGISDPEGQNATVTDTPLQL